MSLITKKGRPAFSKTDDGRIRLTRRYELRSDALEPSTLNTLVFLPEGTPDEKYTNCVLVDHYVTPAPSQGVEHELVRIFEELGDTPVRLGGTITGNIPGAYIGTHGITHEYLAGYTKPARSFTYRYIAKGDISGINAQWLALNSTLAAAGDLPERYLVSESSQSKGMVHTIFSRTYYELPDPYAYPRADSYPFPGKIGFNGNIPIITQLPQTKQTTLRVLEQYYIGPVTRDALGFEPIKWSCGTITYRPALNNPGNYDGYKDFSFSNCIGEAAIAQTNGYFLGKAVNVVSGTISSDPSLYPTGEKLISSRPIQWHGQIWKKVNLFVTFP